MKSPLLARAARHLPAGLAELTRPGALGQLVKDEVGRIVVAERVLREKGMAKALRPRGALALARLALERQTNPAALFRFWAANSPDAVAMAWSTGSWTFAELEDRIARLATGLARRGVGKASTAVIVVKNRPDFLVLHTALGRLGAASVSASWRSTPAELAYLAEHSGASMLFFDHEIVDTVRRTPLPRIPRERQVTIAGRLPGFALLDDWLAARPGRVRASRDEGTVVMYTSGTTGKPKGAVRRFRRETLGAALGFIGETPMAPGDVHLVACPMYHATAFGFLALSYALGGSVVLLETFEPRAFLEAIERHRVTTTAVVPTMLHRTLALGPSELAHHDTSSLRAIFSGGSALSASVATRTLDAFGDVLFNFYGATETGLVTLASPADLRAAPGTIGRALPGNEIRLLDPEGRDVPAGEVGELYVRNAMLIEGYHHDEAATRGSMQGQFFSVGDLARRDALGRYHLEGRKRDLIISGGVNVYPAEVEAAIEAHPDVAEAAVVGVADAEWGERVVAFVAPRAGATLDPADLAAWCRERLAGPKTPRTWRVVDALPRNPTGKVLKRDLRDAAAGA